MEESAKVISTILKDLKDRVGPMINLLDIADHLEFMIKDLGAKSVNKGFKVEFIRNPFPSVVCLGVNDTVAHGIPVDYYLKEGDILSMDLGITYKGFSADAAMTLPIGKISSRDQRLLRHAKKALYKGISMVKEGVMISEIGREIERFANQTGFVINKKLCGHGIGKKMHEAPKIPHYDFIGDPGTSTPDYKLKAGDFICLEPMLTYKDDYGVTQMDGWTIKTLDGRNSAFFEHMIEVLPNGARILTDHITEDEKFEF